MQGRNALKSSFLNLRRLNHHYSQHVERPNNFLINLNHEHEIAESPHLAPSNVNMFLFDEVNLINNERLILIQNYTLLIRTLMEKVHASGHPQGSNKDSQTQL